MQIFFHKKFQKMYKKLPVDIRECFDERMLLFRENSFDLFLRNHSVEAAYPGCRSINVTGNYRAIFQDNGTSAEFIAIGAHSQLY